MSPREFCFAVSLVDMHSAAASMWALGVCSAAVGALTLMFEKSASELKHKQKLLKCKSTIHIATFNIRTFN